MFIVVFIVIFAVFVIIAVTNIMTSITVPLPFPSPIYLSALSVPILYCYHIYLLTIATVTTFTLIFTHIHTQT